MTSFAERQQDFHNKAQALNMSDSQYYEYLKSQQPLLKPVEIPKKSSEYDSNENIQLQIGYAINNYKPKKHWLIFRQK